MPTRNTALFPEIRTTGRSLREQRSSESDHQTLGRKEPEKKLYILCISSLRLCTCAETNKKSESRMI